MGFIVEMEYSKMGSPLGPKEGETAPKGQTVVVGGGRSGGAWGYGPDLDSAKAAFRRNGGLLSKGYAVTAYDAETEFYGVDVMGTTWASARGKVEVVKAKG